MQHGEVLIEGALDLVYRDDELGGWIVVDYKTDAHPIPATVRERYGGQAGAYALAFEVAVGEPVLAVCVLLASLPDAAERRRWCASSAISRCAIWSRCACTRRPAGKLVTLRRGAWARRSKKRS